jgi:hypothetical protein
LVVEAVVDIRRPLQLLGPVEVEQQFGLRVIQSGHEPELPRRLAEVSRVEMLMTSLLRVVAVREDLDLTTTTPPLLHVEV